MPTLSIIATPIGNLEDITLRALRVLGEVDAILCEDTRVTAKLLQKYGIKKPLISYHAHSKLAKTEKIFALLGEGKNLALVSDAGTPCISDPGVLLVSQIREHFGGGVKIVPIPGPSALISALSASGLPSSEFLFIGFLPHKKGRETLFKEIAETKRTVAFYESPHRILKTLASLEKFAPSKKIVIARELTKIYEEFLSGRADELLAHFASHKDAVRGEFAVMVSGV
jgi:16S rRNA (cytidine1402-2'-O)-methyltransferase